MAASAALWLDITLRTPSPHTIGIPANGLTIAQPRARTLTSTPSPGSASTWHWSPPRLATLLLSVHVSVQHVAEACRGRIRPTHPVGHRVPALPDEHDRQIVVPAPRRRHNLTGTPLHGLRNCAPRPNDSAEQANEPPFPRCTVNVPPRNRRLWTVASARSTAIARQRLRTPLGLAITERNRRSGPRT